MNNLCASIKQHKAHILTIVFSVIGYAILRWLYFGIGSSAYADLAILMLFIVLLCMKQGAIALCGLLLLTASELHGLYCDLTIAKAVSGLQSDLVRLKLSVPGGNYGNQVLMYGLLRLGLLAILFAATWQLRKRWMQDHEAGSITPVT